MATKWKNTEICLKGKEWIIKIVKRGELRLIPGVLGCLLGFVVLIDLKDARWYLTEETLTSGSFMNLFLGVGLWGLLGYGLRFWNRSWKAASEDFFEEWKQKLKRQQMLLTGAMVVLLLAAVWNFYYMIDHPREYYNYSVGYMLIGTVVVQWIVCECTVISYMKKRLGQFMEVLEQINQKNLESALRSEQMKVDLISNVSHDLKTPLTSMVGYIELIKKEELSDTLSDYVEVLSRKAQKLKEMIDSLFDLAKTSSGNIELKLEPMELNRLIEQVQADMEDKITESGREMVVMLTKENTGFVADSSYMYRICQNLMENALKYSQENTRIFLKTSVTDSEPKQDSVQDAQKKVRFEITNTAGYRMEFTKEQIVERFARGDESRTTEGNGLGLAIVNTYTAALGGSFDVTIDCDQFKAAVEFLK